MSTQCAHHYIIATSKVDLTLYYNFVNVLLPLGVMEDAISPHERTAIATCCRHSDEGTSAQSRLGICSGRHLQRRGTVPDWVWEVCSWVWSNRIGSASTACRADNNHAVECQHERTTIMQSSVNMNGQQSCSRVSTWTGENRVYLQFVKYTGREEREGQREWVREIDRYADRQR